MRVFFTAAHNGYNKTSVLIRKLLPTTFDKLPVYVVRFTSSVGVKKPTYIPIIIPKNHKVNTQEIKYTANISVHKELF